MRFFVINEIYDVMSYLFAVMICNRNSVLEIIHEDRVLLTDISRVDIRQLLYSFGYGVLML